MFLKFLKEYSRNRFRVLLMILYVQIYVVIEKILTPSTLFFQQLTNGKKTIDNTGYTGAVLMNLSKAFDSINHELLIVKIYAYGYSKDALKLIIN